MTDECDCVDCQTEGEFEVNWIRFQVDEVLCPPHGEPECPLCLHGVEGYDC